MRLFRQWSLTLRIAALGASAASVSILVLMVFLLGARLWQALLLAVAGFLVAMAAALPLARRISEPIKEIAASTAEVAAGRLNICLNIRRQDEIGELAGAFNQMVERLATLQDQLMERKRLERELELAAEIQRSFLPRAYPWSNRFRLNARTQPAEQIGGDFYDFIELADNRLGLLLGDVSGKGIAAALVMAHLVSGFRYHARLAESPAAVLRGVNTTAFQQSRRGMFVTAVYMVLDVPRGLLRYASAGHLPLIYLPAGAGAAQTLATADGVPLGVLSDAAFGEREVVLKAHDAVVAVTDGVVEARNAQGESFTLERLARSAGSIPRCDERVVDWLFGELERFTQGAPPHDDMSVLVVNWC